MKSWMLALLILPAVCFSADTANTTVNSAANQTANAQALPKIHYKQQSGTVDFQELLIQGQIRRAEVSIVTGNTQQGTDGLLRLREDFTDRIRVDSGEKL